MASSEHLPREDKIMRMVYEALASTRGRHRLRKLFVEMVTDPKLSQEERHRAREAIERLNEMDAAGARGSA